MKKLRKLLIVAAALAVLTAICAFSALGADLSVGIAKVATTELNMRSGPGCDYSVMHTLSKGSTVVIIDREFGFWYRVNYDGTEGYVARRYLTDVSESGFFLVMGEVTGNNVRVRREATTESEIITQYSSGEFLTVIGIEDGWYRVRANGETGYMRSDYVDIVSEFDPTLLEEGATKPVKNRAPYPTEMAPPMLGSELTLSEQIANYALQFVGDDYVYGGAAPGGFDCSGLVYYVYKQFGYSLYHGSTTLYNNYGGYIDRAELVPGDLVFFGYSTADVQHVGIYIGDGQMVHASDYDVGVIISDITTTYYQNWYFGAKRIIGYEPCSN
ncbi:MAG: SH3 domain-containing protein [Oscillospiraceae bacterium]|nr:SH3 domain-containing protein [Oscillospiraceae bacterium]